MILKIFTLIYSLSFDSGFILYFLYQSHKFVIENLLAKSFKNILKKHTYFNIEPISLSNENGFVTNKANRYNF